MKKIISIIFLTIVMSNLVNSQVAINTDGSSYDNNAILDIKSINKGILIPRMSNAQIQLIPSPAAGLLVYSTDDSKTYCFHIGDNEWKELAIGASGITPYAIYSIGTSSVLSGSIYEGVTILPSSINLIITGNISVPGCWSITTTLINGYSFSGSGTITSTGTAYFMLYASGTPVVAQTDNFTATANNSGGTYAFTVTVNPAPTYPSGTAHCISGGAEIQDVYNPTTGKTWMDRNLGASQVATSFSDSDAYGDLYQWGRLSDGHQCRSSGNTTTLSNSDNPGHGDFILTWNASNCDWRSPQNSSLWQGYNGVNNPCPSGYRIPTFDEWNNERLSWSSNSKDGAFASPLKLTTAAMRNTSGGISNEGAGYYWGSSTSSGGSCSIFIYDGAFMSSSSCRGQGFSVRCIKD